MIEKLFDIYPQVITSLFIVIAVSRACLFAAEYALKKEADSIAIENYLFCKMVSKVAPWASLAIFLLFASAK